MRPMLDSPDMATSGDTTVEFVVVDFADLRNGPASNGVGWRSVEGEAKLAYNEVIREMYLPRVLRAVDPDDHPAGTVIARVTFHDPDNHADSTFEWEAGFTERRAE